MPSEELKNPTNDPEEEDHASDKKKEATGKKGPATKEKLQSIMEAASALTALGDEDEEEGVKGDNKKQEPKEDKEDDSEFDGKKRFIPEHKKPDAALTFPEKMMSMMKYADNENPDEFCIAWLADGKSFVIRNPEAFTRNVLPKFFKATKFSSFTRKLYRWGFRQVNRGIGPDDPIIFGNEYFQRDNEALMAKMRSVTAAGTRRAQSFEEAQKEIEAASRKRPMDVEMQLEEQRKRIFLGQMIARQQNFGIPQDPASAFLESSAFQQSFGLGSALRSPMGAMPSQAFKGMGAMGASALSQNPLNMYMPPSAQNMQSYSSASTSDIVNAAINALRYAS